MASLAGGLGRVLRHADRYEDAFYTGSLVAAVPLAMLFPLLPAGRCRALYSTALGVFNALIFCREQSLYLLLSLILSYICMIRRSWDPTRRSRLPRYLYPFGVIGLARFLDTVHVVPLYPLSNAVLLLFTLRLIDFAHYVETFKAEDMLSTGTAVLFLTHVFYFPGFWSGPILPPEHTMSVVLEADAPLSEINTSRSTTTTESSTSDEGDKSTADLPLTQSVMTPASWVVESLTFLWLRVRQTAFHLVAFIILSRMFNALSAVHGPDASRLDQIVQWDISPLSKALYCFGSLVLFRARFLVAWLLAETATVFSGARTDRFLDATTALKVYQRRECRTRPLKGNDVASSTSNNTKLPPPPSSSLDLVMDRTAISRNYTSWNVELATSLSDILRSWNQSVQSWLVRNVYKVYRPPSQAKRRLAVFALSAYWHGLHVGYYVAFLGLAGFQLCQTVFSARLSSWLPKEHRVRYCVEVVLTQLLISFIVVPFICQTMPRTILVWSAMHYYGIVLCGILWIFGTLMPQKKGRTSVVGKED